MGLVDKYSSVMGGIHKATIDAISKADLQSVNQYEVLIIRPNADGQFGTAGAVAGSVIDTVFAKIFIYGSTIPSFGYEKASLKGTSYAKHPLYPDTITLVFLEDAYGIARRYIQNWINDVATPYKFQLESGNKKVTYRSRIFADNQRLAKRNVNFLMTTFNNLPIYPRITCFGVFPLSVGELELNNESGGEKMLLTLTCSVDDIFVPVLV